VQYLTYEPPYSYTYQCASTIYINFTSVFIYMFIITGLIIPVGKIILFNLSRYYSRGIDNSTTTIGTNSTSNGDRSISNSSNSGNSSSNPMNSTTIIPTRPIVSASSVL
jgi:hypothetical protein